MSSGLIASFVFGVLLAVQYWILERHGRDTISFCLKRVQSRARLSRTSLTAFMVLAVSFAGHCNIRAEAAVSREPTVGGITIYRFGLVRSTAPMNAAFSARSVPVDDFRGDDATPSRYRVVRSYAYDALVLLRRTRATNATKAGGKTEIWRAVEPDELADLIGSGKYRPGPGNEGKYFFPTKAQAKNLADNILPGRKFCITSGCIDSSVLAKIDKIYPAGEGQAWFIPNELLPYIDNIVIHGPA
jgi:hypothetical protein